MKIADIREIRFTISPNHNGACRFVFKDGTWVDFGGEDLAVKMQFQFTGEQVAVKDTSFDFKETEDISDKDDK